MIYLIDDYMPQNGELNFDKYSTCIKTFEFVPNDDDMWQDKDAIFFYHYSLEEAYVLRHFIIKNKVPYIVFSGALNVEPEEFTDGWNMDRDTFYSNLKSFLDRYKRDNSIGVKNFFDKDTKTVKAEIGMLGDKDLISKDIISFNEELLSDNPVDINTPSGVEKFVKKHIKEKEYIVFDLDCEALSPAKISYLCAYIRLSLDTIKDAALAPFIFMGKDNFINYINKFQNTKYPNILLWPGSIFRQNKNIKDNDFFKDITPLTEDDYINKFLKHLKIAPKGTTGNHSIANYWGAYVIARNIPKFESQAEEIYLKALEKDALYLKYLIADRIRSVKEVKDIIRGEGKSVEDQIEPLYLMEDTKILLIDDQDDIWTGIIEALLPGADLTVIGKSNGLINDSKESNFLSPDAKNMILNPDFDLILLDLRLGGVMEESEINGDKCSGMKILKEITDKNPGQQVIMFTSSNKAWNLKKALTMAAGYYIKESPLQPFSEDETLQNLDNLIDTIDNCLWYRDLRKVVSQIESLDNLEFKDEYRDAEANSIDVRDQLGIVRTMAISQSREIRTQESNWTYVYIALFQVLEIVKRLNYQYNPADPGNREQDPGRRLGNLVLNLMSYQERDLFRQDLHYHNDLRGELVHRRNNTTDTYNEFLNLWNLVYDILNKLIY